MKLPNAEQARIDREKIVDYLLNPEHRRGASKARLLLAFGYSPDAWEQLANDLRRYHCSTEVSEVRDTDYGKRFEIRAAIVTPSGRSLTVRTVWQIDTDDTTPRLLTLYPD
jgi:hypothetical protein